MCRRNTDENGSESAQVGGFGIIHIETLSSIIKMSFLEVKKRVTLYTDEVGDVSKDYIALIFKIE